MNKKIATLLILALLVSNVVLLFLYLNKGDKGKNGRQRMMSRFKTEVGFTDAQAKQFETLRESQRESTKPLMDSINYMRKAYIGAIFAQQSQDSILQQLAHPLAAAMLNLDKAMYSQLMEARKICTPNQYAVYDSTVKKMMTRIPDKKMNDKSKNN